MREERYGAYTSRSPPIDVGSTYKVKIEGVGREGDGIAKINGFVVFVPGAKVGEELEIKISKITRRVGFGEKID